MKATRLHGTVRFVVLLFATLFAFQINSFAQDTTSTEKDLVPSAKNDIVTTLKNEGTYTWLVDALERTGLAEALQGEEPYTLFAPTDVAVAALPEDTLAALNTEALTELLRYHLVLDAISLEQAATMGTLMTVQGETLTASTSEDGVRINGAALETALEATNGMIYGIDAVLMLPDVRESKPGS
jgi:transforming growth factor-beta-induced protein